MSKVVMAEVTKEGCLLDMPYEILHEIFRTLPKSKLIEISRLCSKFRDVAGDTRIWKDAFIKYEGTLAFEDLYSEPWPVKVIDLSRTEIKPPVSSKIDQVVKVTKLNLLYMKANNVTMGAIFAKYQCKELNLYSSIFDFEEGIAPEALEKQTALEVLSIKCMPEFNLDENEEVVVIGWPIGYPWLRPVLRNCQNLKTLYLHDIALIMNPLGADGRAKRFVKSLPTSLEKLRLVNCGYPKNYFLDLLAKRIPNLRELGLIYLPYVKCTALLKFQLLEAMHFIYVFDHQYDISDFCMYLIKFPALKTIYLRDDYQRRNSPEAVFETFRTMLEPHGIIVRPTEEPKWTYSDVGGHLWHVSDKDV